MKNYKECAYMCDVIIQKALALKIAATSPNLPDWKRELHQHQLYCAYMNFDSSTVDDSDLPF